MNVNGKNSCAVERTANEHVAENKSGVTKYIYRKFTVLAVA